MDFHMEDEEATRLKEILFPKKTRGSVSSADSFCFNGNNGKENLQINNPYDLRSEIDRLKKGMEIFMNRQGAHEIFLTTPRECLEMIKFMSDRLENYNQQIEEAANTLLESIPKIPANYLPICKYYQLMLKINCLNSTYFNIKKRVMLGALKEIKIQANSTHEKQNREKQLIIFANKNHMKKCHRLLSYAMNKWRINTCLSTREENRERLMSEERLRNKKMIGLMSEEGRMVLWLQKLIEGNASTTEILIFNSKNGTLRGYICTNDILSSVFETVENSSMTAEDSIKIRRIQINLEHSLTKICLIKRQPLKVDEIKKDPDYTKVDDVASIHGMSAREMTGGCIFTPILNKSGHSIGIIRQYYLNRPGPFIKSESISEIAELLEHTLKVTAIFNNIKDKTESLRESYFLKAIQTLNTIEKSQNIENSFAQLLSKHFSLHSLCSYQYQTLSNSSKHIITANNSKVDESICSQVIAILGKMQQSNTDHLYEGNRIFIKTDSNMYSMLASVDSNEIMSKIPVKIIKMLLEKKEFLLKEREDQQKLKLQEQEKVMEIIKLKEQEKLLHEMNKFCLEQERMKDVESILKCLNNFVDKFMRGNVVIQLRDRINENEALTVLYDHKQFKVIALGIEQPNSQCLNCLTNLCQFSFKSLLESLSPKHSLELQNLATHYANSPQNSLLSLLSQWLNIPFALLTSYKIQSNPFEQHYYCCYMQMEQNQQQIKNPQQLCKNLRKFAVFNKIALKPMSTFICLSNTIVISIKEFIIITEEQLTMLNSIYEDYQKMSINLNESEKKSKNNVSILIFISKIEEILKPTYREVFVRCKMTMKRASKQLGSCIEDLAIRKNKELLFFSFASIYRANKKKQNKDKRSKFLQNSHRFILAIKSISGLREMFTIYTNCKLKEKKLRKFVQLLESKKMFALHSSMLAVYYRSHLRSRNRLQILNKMIESQLRSAFEQINIFAKTGAVNNCETECSTISMQSSIGKISQILNKNYPNYTVCLELINQSYLCFDLKKISNCAQIPFKTAEHHQFICNSKSLIKHVIWLVPQQITLSLLDKHYLQILSKAIEESFRKFLTKAELFLNFIMHIQKKKENDHLKASLKKWRNQSIQEVIKEQYKWREQFYDISVEVENYRNLQRQTRKEQEQRELQMKENLEMKQYYERNVQNYRQNIVRLEISSRNLQNLEIKAKLERSRKELDIAFRSWRRNTAVLKKMTNVAKLKRNRLEYSAKIINEILCKIKGDHSEHALKMIMIKSADVKAEKKSAKKKSIFTDLDLNRLVTFQNEDFLYSEDRESQKQVSIIPISFKNFETTTKKENVEVNEEEMKRINGGSYKLNPKTLKFLKRMGKMNPA